MPRRTPRALQLIYGYEHSLGVATVHADIDRVVAFDVGIGNEPYDKETSRSVSNTRINGDRCPSCSQLVATGSSRSLNQYLPNSSPALDQAPMIWIRHLHVDAEGGDRIRFPQIKTSLPRSGRA